MQQRKFLMNANIPSSIKIYHIVHIDNLTSIIADGYLFSDAEMRKRPNNSVLIGMNKIKDRRLTLALMSHKKLRVGECVPFYFCPRSPMLYMFHKANSSDIKYRDGQDPIVHLVVDLRKAISWANANDYRWAFTSSNAGSYYFDDFADLNDLDKIDWQAVRATQWNDRDIKEKKQAEFLVENCFPWKLVEGIGVFSRRQYDQIQELHKSKQKLPLVKIKKEWYY
jgi:hypothetical protein